MIWEQVANEIKERVMLGTITVKDIELAQDIYENARSIWDEHVWIRALGGWRAEIEEASSYVKSEIELEERTRGGINVRANAGRNQTAHPRRDSQRRGSGQSA